MPLFFKLDYKKIEFCVKLDILKIEFYVTVWIQRFLLNPAVRFPFFFLRVSVREETKFTVHETNVTVHALFRYYLCTVHGIHSYFIQKKY